MGQTEQTEYYAIAKRELTELTKEFTNAYFFGDSTFGKIFQKNFLLIDLQGYKSCIY